LRDTHSHLAQPEVHQKVSEILEKERELEQIEQECGFQSPNQTDGAKVELDQ